MRYAILSDIHSNLEAFQAVLRDLGAANIQKIAILGDIVGYGANPQECIELAQEKAELIVAGNHDWAVAGRTDPSNFNSLAFRAVEWTISHLGTDYQKFLSELPLKIEEDDFLLVHASPLNSEDWHYIFSRQEAIKNLNVLKQRVCFVGHSHIPAIYYLNEFGDIFFSRIFAEVSLNKKNRFLINVGSVGQPRDHIPLASYGIFDSRTFNFCLRRISYPIEIAQKKIIAAGLPVELAERLAEGW
ncbi:MAG: metallophosphatase family protein [Desulfobacterota bacterium]|nr:metallophosphatase family protein [Thermodesulfobacteriota bacterium]